ncbi:hydantoinase B/oxoprolinase family protein [Bythopirellula polymerisocia]|uniref:Acetophenone carboxylase gamma subunit n=1 Tax=Bythopirellula polymerisocia TaxID=2528003 RepID=A0A5C6CFD1_9BACT|nr:hydantoinase B/oxoprolinase family protein [Bythopirellula polymerisocia]TWU22832.1 Acetophenone carboxylase gamma subunit [Bythopirellula polymerisocia]
MLEPPWEFWIDVGGTFTDCLAKNPDGSIRRHKLLSSAVTKGTVASGSSSDRIVDPSRISDPANFWSGFSCTLLSEEGTALSESTVVAFEPQTGELRLAPALEVPPLAGSTYELRCKLEAPILAIRYLLGLPLNESLPPVRLRLGTTRGTNALLTRTGAHTALAITRGFGDLLEIGSQERPDLFALRVVKPPPLAERSVEIDERVAADGSILRSPDHVDIRSQLSELKSDGIESLAICLMHADLYPEHELIVEQIAREVGFREISRSSDVAPLVKIVPRAETTVVDAYLCPVLRDYLDHLHNSLPGSQIRLMTSAGGLVGSEAFRGHMSVLSGPAGGVVGYAQIAAATGFERAIGFDMGGTSTDVSRFDGTYEYEYETRKAGVRLVTPMLAINTVAAGGGSICRFDGTQLTVGPESAGADPGPACYGRGGPLTVTDLNFFLGRIAVDRFPFRLDRKAVERQLDSLTTEVLTATGETLTCGELAEGLLTIANANMVRAIRGVSIAKGADPADYLLVPFGGAAAQHVCAVARELGIKKILNHPDSGILSAYGIGQADVVRHAARGLSQLVDAIDHTMLASMFDELECSPLAELVAEGFATEQIEIHQTLDMRYSGTDVPLNVSFGTIADVVATFESLHRQQFGYVPADKPIELVALRVEALGKTGRLLTPSTQCPARHIPPTSQTACRLSGHELQISRYDREALAPGALLTGPAVIADIHSTILVETGWQCETLSGGELLLTDILPEQSVVEEVAQQSEAVMLAVFNNLFAGIAEQMGHVLRRTALSVNVKERLDYSCAVFTATGELVANAPHVPVHLGAMGATVRAVLAENPELAPGDVYVSNDPYRGGSHLPDVTVVTPVHDSQSGDLLFFTACRAHHAEIGGVRPGSMPPNSRSLGEEGVLISNFALVRNGSSRDAELKQLLSHPPYPSRRVEENLADVRAQVAANQQGARELLELVERYTLAVVQEKMRGIQDSATTKVQQALARFGKQTRTFTDYLETAEGESVPICVTFTFQPDTDGAAAIIDFTGSGPVVVGNLNANPAIVSAAVLYVLRLLVDEHLPLNEGALRAVEIILHPGLLNPPPGDFPAASPAVAAGNVESSQRVVDVLLGALGVAAASQGTMNNLLFGNSEFGYYETICGGSGATPDGPGASAVQVHMTNTRATDPEILERRLPVRLLEFSTRYGSGGEGKHRGGDGVVRRLEFLAPLELSLITERRGPHAPYGINGGKSGQLGENILQYAHGTEVDLPGICEINVEPGDVLIIKTPGGGGWKKSN